VFCALIGVSQKKTESDTVRNKFMPTGIRLGTDVISVIRTLTVESFGGYEFSADVDFYRYFLTLEAGRWERDLKTETDTYANSGNYFRVGMDVNFLKGDPDKNMFFIGARYGKGTFSENLSIEKMDPVWGVITESYANDNSKASWLELTTGLRVKMWKHFWMGYTARYKFGLSTKETTNMIPHEVPGYGRTDKESTWGFNYQVLFRIPLRKIN
jgi:hypothetical protein